MDYSKQTVIKIFDEKNYLNNVLVPLSLKVNKTIFLYRGIVPEHSEQVIRLLLHKNQIMTEFVTIKEDSEAERYVEDLDVIVDLSPRKYLTLYLFEKVLTKNNLIVYYDDEEDAIKDYRRHTVLTKDIYSLSIADLIALSGARIDYNMHDAPDLKDDDYIAKIKQVILKTHDCYPQFTNYISRLIQIIKEGKYEYRLDQPDSDRLRNNGIYPVLAENGIITIHDDDLIIKDKRFIPLLKNAGAWLESYLYIRLMEHNKLDECIMSAVIEFMPSIKRYPITCEIDLLAIKNNRLLLISCKSNKVDAYAINEICLHNYVFGNDLSKAVIATFEDLNTKNPPIYNKGRELGVAIIDQPRILSDDLDETLVAITNGKYEYERTGK